MGSAILEAHRQAKCHLLFMASPRYIMLHILDYAVCTVQPLLMFTWEHCFELDPPTPSAWGCDLQATTGYMAGDRLWAVGVRLPAHYKF